RVDGLLAGAKALARLPGLAVAAEAQQLLATGQVPEFHLAVPGGRVRFGLNCAATGRRAWISSSWRQFLGALFRLLFWSGFFLGRQGRMQVKGLRPVGIGCAGLSDGPVGLAAAAVGLGS